MLIDARGIIGKELTYLCCSALLQGSMVGAGGVEVLSVPRGCGEEEGLVT